MKTFIVLRDHEGFDYVGETWQETIDAAKPDAATEFTAARLVEARDARWAELDPERGHRQTLQPPQQYQLLRYDTWGNAEEGYNVNDAFFDSIVWISDDMSDADVLRAIDARDGVEIDPNSGDGRFEFIATEDGKPLGAAERIVKL